MANADQISEESTSSKIADYEAEANNGEESEEGNDEGDDDADSDRGNGVALGQAASDTFEAMSSQSAHHNNQESPTNTAAESTITGVPRFPFPAIRAIIREGSEEGELNHYSFLTITDPQCAYFRRVGGGA